MKKEIEMVKEEIKRQCFLMNKAINEGDVEGEKEHRDEMMQLMKTLADIESKDGEKKDGRMKAITYVVGTAATIIGFAGLSILYACIDATGSTGREAKNYLKDVWKNRPILK